MVQKAKAQALHAKRRGKLLSPFKPPTSAIAKKLSPPKKSSTATSSSPSTTKTYKGVRMRTWGKWVSEIREPNKRTRIWLGSFSTAEMAAKAYDAAVVCLRGPSAPLNFPDAPPRDLPRCSTPRDVQAAAAAAAAAAARAPSRANSGEQHSPNDVGPQRSSQSASQVVTSEVEDWIDAEYGSLEALDEAQRFPELTVSTDLSSMIDSMVHDEHSRGKSPPDESSHVLDDHSLWTYFP